MHKPPLKEILSVNVCKIFVAPLKYLMPLYNLSENGGTENCFYSKFGKDTFFFICPKRGLEFCMLSPYSWLSLNLCLGLEGEGGCAEDSAT